SYDYPVDEASRISLNYRPSASSSSSSTQGDSSSSGSRVLKVLIVLLFKPLLNLSFLYFL
ncbi:MAG: hypothetical protein JW739_00005, partial [Opitutales bacterium]|nr:hypothetical protein [Opitutales bacterium]